ncbi:MAG: hypothetical protein ACR2GR_08035 [Rhodothermales bacterium]
MNLTLPIPLPRAAALLLVTTALLLSACEEAPDRQARTPPDEGFERDRATALQDSLLGVVQPGQFHAVMPGNPMNADNEVGERYLSMEGPITVERAEGEEARTVRLTMKEGARQVVLELQHEAGDAAADTASLLRPGTYEQQLDVLPTVIAEVRDRRRRFSSRSGTLELEETAEGELQGRFFFEVQPRDEGIEEEWFGLTGVFKAMPEGDDAS